MVRTLVSPKRGTVEIAVVGKYISLRDSYKSIYEALTHGGVANNCRVKVRMVESEDIQDDGPEKHLKGVSGILVPGGFGDRGIEGKIRTVQYARTRRIPFFGICLGMQCAVIEFARHVAGLADANSTEFNAKTPHPVIDLMEEQKAVSNLGGTMRLGSYPCRVADGTLARKAYGATRIQERHRHRYEFNNAYRERLVAKGLRIGGICTESDLVEMVELPGHPWFLGCQFHPEFQSTPLNAHPLFGAFVGAALRLQRG
jgi:CTP synthase